MRIAFKKLFFLSTRLFLQEGKAFPPKTLLRCLLKAMPTPHFRGLCPDISWKRLVGKICVCSCSTVNNDMWTSRASASFFDWFNCHFLILLSFFMPHLYWELFFLILCLTKKWNELEIRIRNAVKLSCGELCLPKCLCLYCSIQSRMHFYCHIRFRWSPLNFLKKRCALVDQWLQLLFAQIIVHSIAVFVMQLLVELRRLK